MSRFFTLLSALVFCSALASAQDKTAKIDTLVTRYHDYGKFDGAVLVAEHGQVLYRKGFGLANREWDIPIQPDTKFRLGSITKQFTAMAVLQLVRDGKLRLDGKVTDYLPEYPKKSGDLITIHHLLSHTSGIPNFTSFPDYQRRLSRLAFTPAEFLRVFADSALQFPPGSRYSYSNSGYFLLGAIIEKVTGKPYEQVLRENIFTPLKMLSSGYDRSAPVLPKRATGYDRRFSTYTNAGFIDMSVPFSAGALYSTVEDLVLWDQALYTDRLLPDSLRKLLFTPHARVGEGGDAYGYGWFIGKVAGGGAADSVTIVQHGGGINGFVTVLTRIPSEHDFIVILSNASDSPVEEMSQALRNVLLGKPYAMPRKSLAAVLWRTIQEQGLDSAVSRFHRLKTDRADLYEVLETEMNRAGYMLLLSGRVPESIAVFRLNVEEFPNSYNVYDSLGEAYMVSGNKELAIRNYEKSVALNPGNTNGVEKLRQLRAR